VGQRLPRSATQGRRRRRGGTPTKGPYPGDERRGIPVGFSRVVLNSSRGSDRSGFSRGLSSQTRVERVLLEEEKQHLRRRKEEEGGGGGQSAGI